MKVKQTKNRGFTLIELVIVVAILAILVGLLAPSYTKYVKKSKVTKCETQRDEIERVFQVACIEDSSLENELEKPQIDSELILNKLEKMGFFNADEAICPVYNVKYSFTCLINTGKIVAQVVCPCVDKMKSYVDMAFDNFKKNYDTDQTRSQRNQQIKDLYDKAGGLLKVSEDMKKGTNFEKETLYWRPYVLNNGTVTMYASTQEYVEGLNGDVGVTAGWKASLFYVEGKLYQSTKKKWNGSPDENGFSRLYKEVGTTDNAMTFDQWAKVNGFELVK